jgi:hypothetical protein
VVLLEDKILEGRNRALAVDQLGKELKTVDFEDLNINQSPLDFVISSNLHRRHLTDHQRVQIAAQLAKLLAEETTNKSGAQAPLYKNDNETGRGKKGPASIAAAQVGVSKSSVNRALAQESARLQYREQIASRLSGEKPLEEFFEKLDQGEILSGPSDLKLFAGLPSVRMKQLLKHVLKTSTFREAQDQEEEEESRKLQTKLRTRLQALFSQVLDQARPKLGSGSEDYKAAFQKAIAEATCDELLSFAAVEPGADLSQINLHLIDEAIEVCHERNKDKRGREVAAISFHDILELRAEAIPFGDDQSTPPAPEQDKGKPLLSEKGAEALEQLITVLRNNIADRNQYFAKCSERDLLNWAFPESVLRTRQIRLSMTGIGSLHKIIQQVDIKRTTALNIDDIATWKSSSSGPEEFYFTIPNGLLFTVKIESRTGALGQRDTVRFLDIDEAIRRYSREHGHLVNAPAAEADTDLSFEESVI